MTNSTEISTVSKAVENPTITVDGFKLKKLSIITTFSDTAKIDKAIAKFTTEALSVIPDLSTIRSRGDIASIAYKISKKKGNIVSQMIDPSIEEAKALVKNVNAGKKYFQTKMDNLRDEVRAPLNEWEATEKIKEEKRIKDIQEKIQGISAIITFDPNNPPNKDDITSLIEAVDSIDCTEGFDEFTQDALQTRSQAKEVLSEMLNKLIQKELEEAQQQELAEQQERLDNAQRVMEAKAKAQERLNKLIMIPSTMFGKTSIELNKKLNKIDLVEINEAEFGELFDQANAAKAQVIVQLGQMEKQQTLFEKAQEILATDRTNHQQENIVDTNFDISVDTGPKSEVIKEAVGGVMLTDKIIEVNTSKPSADFAFDEKPVEQRLADRFTGNTKRGVSKQNTTVQIVETVPLTPHQKMVKDFRFWAKEYGVVNSEYSDLMNIVNRYEQYFKEV